MEDNLLEDTMSYGVFTVLSKFTTLRMFYLDFWVRRILYFKILSYGEFHSCIIVVVYTEYQYLDLLVQVFI